MNPRVLVRRIRGKSPRYLAKRAYRELRGVLDSSLQRQVLRRVRASAVLRRCGVSTATEFVRQWAAEGPFLRDHDRRRIRAWYDAHPDARDRLAERGERALAHVVDLLGSGPVALGARIDWSKDFKTGYRWPLTPSERMEYSLLELPCDVKVPWELSRFQHLVPAGQLWIVGADPRTAAEFGAQIESWDSANPLGYGANWACTMDVALRAYSLTWLSAAFADAPSCDESVWRRVVRMLWQHGSWIERHLEISDVNGNHLLADALGLVACGAYFRATPAGARWLRTGRAILVGEIQLQILADGVDVEASVPYQRLVMEIFVAARELLRFAGCGVTDVYDERLTAAARFLTACTTPDGLSPVVGDADDGRVFRFGQQDVRDFAYLREIVAAILGIDEVRPRGPVAEETIWFLNENDLDRLARTTPANECGCALFPSGGVAVFRTPAQYLFVDVGPVGLFGRGGHGHNDVLSFEWHARGRPVLTDSGSYVYTAAPAWRNAFRSTEYHTVLRVDGQELNRFPIPMSLWSLEYDAVPDNVQFDESPELSWVEAGHRGYTRLADPVRVRRRFEVSRHDPTLVVRDEVEARAEHLYEWFFQVAPQYQGRVVDGYLELADGARPLHRIAPDTERGSWELLEGWFSPSYGIRVPRQRWKYRARVHGSFSLTFILTALTTN